MSPGEEFPSQLKLCSLNWSEKTSVMAAWSCIGLLATKQCWKNLELGARLLLCQGMSPLLLLLLNSTNTNLTAGYVGWGGWIGALPSSHLPNHPHPQGHRRTCVSVPSIWTFTLTMCLMYLIHLFTWYKNNPQWWWMPSCLTSPSNMPEERESRHLCWPKAPKVYFGRRPLTLCRPDLKRAQSLLGKVGPKAPNHLACT